MRLGLRGLVFSLLPLFVAMACMGGENQCLNPHPELPSCGALPGGNASGGKFGASGGSSNGNEIPTGPAAKGGSSSNPVGQGGGPSEPATGDGGDAAGAGGDTAINPEPEGGAGGAAGSSGATGRDESP